MSSIAGIPFRADNRYENPFNSSVKFVGYKTYKMKRIKVLKSQQYKVENNIVTILDKDIKIGTGDKVFIEV